MNMSEVPFVVRDGSKTAIVVKRTPKIIEMIQMDSGGLRVKKIPLKEAVVDWKVYTAYPTHKAAMIYYKAAVHLDGVDSSISKIRDIIMQFIITEQGKVLGATMHPDTITETFGPLVDDRDGYATLAELRTLGIDNLIKVYNSCVEEKDRVPTFYEGLNEAAAAAMSYLE
jgi:hypothetical protein